MIHPRYKLLWSDAERAEYAKVIYSHDTIDILLCIARHLLIPRQFPVFQSDNSGNTVSRGSRLKLSAVLS